MLFRFLALSVLKWLANFAAAFILLGFVLPNQFTGLELDIPVWIVSTLIAFMFATWAVSKKMPSNRDTFMLLAIWTIVSITGFLIYGMVYSNYGPWAVVSPEILIQLVLESVAVYLACYRVRRMRIKSVLGEGMTV